MNWKLTLGCIMIILGIVYGSIFWFIAIAPADLRYNRLFGSHVIMAYDQADFDGILNEINVVWEQMNVTFVGFDYSGTYNTPWFWQQTYDNSLKAQQDYFIRLTKRIDSYKEQYENLKTNPGAIILVDWYDAAIRNLREEMKREGGLDWVIHDAWYLHFAPMVYWSIFTVAVPMIILIIAGIIFVLWGVA